MLIATRVLKVREPGGDIEMTIRLFAPARDGQAEGCRFEIDWPDGHDVKTIYGVDKFQAIHLAMQCIGVLLYTSEAHRSGKLFWEEPGRGYGFPVTKNLRDLLVGDDRRFDGP